MLSIKQAAAQIAKLRRERVGQSAERQPNYSIIRNLYAAIHKINVLPANFCNIK
jgi:hypothetical protein